MHVSILSTVFCAMYNIKYVNSKHVYIPRILYGQLLGVGLSFPVQSQYQLLFEFLVACVNAYIKTAFMAFKLYLTLRYECFSMNENTHL